jgi:predicted Kef-type K+ transport protein
VVLPSVVFGLSHISQVILGNSVAEWLPQMIIIIPLSVGLGAIALRLESLWPLVLWHFAVEVTGGLAANPAALMELATIGLIFVVFVVGVGLLWHDRKLLRPQAPVHAKLSA